MTFDPFKVKTFRRSGNGNIAERITHPQGLVLVALRARFSGGTGDADLTLVTVDANTSNAVATLHTVADAGTGGEANIHVPIAVDEVALGAWTVLPGEILQINWTNPDAPNMTWELEARYQLAA